jgi:hypothetical protein
MKREAKFNIKFNHWLKSVYKETMFYELKQTSGSLPFSAVKPHQIEGLQQVRHGTLVYKMPDVGFQNFCDGFCVTEQPACIVIKYPTFFCLISIDTFVLESKRSKRRSLTAARAKDIAQIVIHN